MVLVTGVFWLLLSQSKGSERVPEKLLSLSSLEGSNLAPAPGCSLIIAGNCPHLEGRAVLKGSAVPLRKF
jgi:hypothetical protein